MDPIPVYVTFLLRLLSFLLPSPLATTHKVLKKNQNRYTGFPFGVQNMNHLKILFMFILTKIYGLVLDGSFSIYTKQSLLQYGTKDAL
jgi:hypothetical protein